MTAATMTPIQRRRAVFRQTARRFWASTPGRIGVLTLLAFVALAVLAPLVADRAGSTQSRHGSTMPPSGARLRSSDLWEPTIFAGLSGPNSCGEHGSACSSV